MMRTLLVALLVTLLLAGLGCGREQPPPRPQWLVQIGTDATVPQFGDRMLVEVFDGDGVVIQNQLGLGPATQWPVSFGLVPPERGGVFSVRARLYRSSDADENGNPRSNTLIDARGKLPPPTQVSPVSLPLSMNCFGVPSTVDMTCDPLTGGAIEPPMLSDEPLVSPGTWSPAQKVACPEAIDEDMVCIEGGAFLLGSGDELVPIDERAALAPERLVQLRPFALDRDEVTVRAVRELAEQGLLDDEPTTRASDPSCTYVGQGDPSNDAMPVNCISLALAEQVCMRLAKRLPTEAQWEFAAGNREQETPFPWGADGDVCAHARIGWGVGPPNEDSSCAAPTSPTGPTPEGHVGDKTELGIANMAGNLSEWARGYIAPYDAPCWNPSARLLLDPWCDDPASGLWAARGDAYAYAPYLAPVVFRNPMVGSAGSATVGLRCARTWN